FYPFELIENFQRFKNQSQTIIYDRHPIDRMALKYELLLRNRLRKVNFLRFIIEYPLRCFWAELYRYFFTRIEHLYVLLPDSELSFERSGGQYATNRDASIKRKAYYLSAKRYSSSNQSLKKIYIKEDLSIAQITGILR